MNFSLAWSDHAQPKPIRSVAGERRWRHRSCRATPVLTGQLPTTRCTNHTRQIVICSLEGNDMAEVLPPKYRPESVKSIAKRPLATESKLGDRSDTSPTPNSESVSASVIAPAKSDLVHPVVVRQAASPDRNSTLSTSHNDEGVFVPVSVPAQSDPIHVTPVGRQTERVLPNAITSSSGERVLGLVTRQKPWINRSLRAKPRLKGRVNFIV